MKNLFILLTILTIALTASSQRITYAEANKDDLSQTNFEIIGRYNSHVLIYKNFRTRHTISTYNADMKETQTLNLDYLPDRVINVDFIAYPTHCWMIYQYQKRNIVYCTAQKIDADGAKSGVAIDLDTTDISYNSNNKLYTIITSENKRHIMILKVNSKNEKRFLFKTLLFDSNLNQFNTTRTTLPMNDRKDILTDFSINNEATLIFGRGDRQNTNDNINQFSLILKAAQADTFTEKHITLNQISLDEVKIKPDNANQHIVLTSFYYKAKKSSIEGIFHCVWDVATQQETINLAIPLSDEIRSDARGENSIKNAFNEYYLQQIILKKDGGFVIAAENQYTTTRGNINSANRFNNFYSPYAYSNDYYYNNSGYPYYNRFGGQTTRYNADNVVILSFDNTGKLAWSNVIRKSQYDDDGEAAISYQLINTGDAAHFLYNDFEKRDPLLAVQSIDPEGKIIRNPTLKNLDQGYSFLPRYAKQVGQRQVIVPCLYRNFLAFAKIDF